MYICKDCGAVFEEPNVWRDDPSPAGVALPSGYYEYWECPKCGSEDIDEAKQCEVCGEYIAFRGICDTCMAEITEEVKQIQKSRKLSDSTFREVMDDIIESNW